MIIFKRNDEKEILICLFRCVFSFAFFNFHFFFRRIRFILLVNLAAKRYLHVTYVICNNNMKCWWAQLLWTLKRQSRIPKTNNFYLDGVQRFTIFIWNDRLISEIVIWAVSFVLFALFNIIKWFLSRKL